MSLTKLNAFKSGRLCLSVIAIATAAMFVANGPSIAKGTTQMNAETKPIIEFVHGAFADSSSWEGVTRILLAQHNTARNEKMFSTDPLIDG